MLISFPKISNAMQNTKFHLYFILDFCIFGNYQKCLLFKLKPFCLFFWGFFCFCFCFSFFGHLIACGIPGGGIRSKLQLRPMPQLQQCWILNLLPTVPGQGLNLHPSAPETLLILLYNRISSAPETLLILLYNRIFFFEFLLLFLSLVC